MVLAFVKMLGRLEAGRQLAAIEASLVTEMKPEAVKRIMERHVRRAQPPEERKPVAMELMDGFRQAGWAVVEE